MEKIVALPVEQLKGNGDNPFPKLSDAEYNDLKESIVKYGILEPVIVYSQNGLTYEVLSGNHRLRVAKEIGMKQVPCLVIDLAKIEGAFDTEVFRRHIPESDRDRYIKLKQEASKNRLEKELQRSLIPEIYQIYKTGKMSLETTLHLAIADVNSQMSILNSVIDSGGSQGLEEKEDEENEKLKEEISNLHQTVTSLQSKLAEKETELKKARKYEEELKNQIEENMDKIKKESSQKAPQDGRIMEQLKSMEEVNEKLRKQIREKENEIEKIKEEKARIEADAKRKEEEIKNQQKMLDIELTEKRRNHLYETTISRINSIMRAIAEIEGTELDCLLKKQVSGIRKEIQKIIHHLDKLDRKIASLE